MDNQLALWPEAPVQVAYDYSRVTSEQADKLQTIYNRVLIRHMATAYEDGKDLLEARDIQGLPYKEFIAWAEGAFGWHEQSILNKMNVALRWGPITPTVGVIEDRAMYLLSTKNTPGPARQEAKQLLDSGISVNEELAKQLRDKHKADLEAIEKQKEDLQKQLDLFKESSEKQIVLLKWEKQLQDSERDAKLKKLEEDLKTTNEEKEKIARSKKEIIQEDKTETKAKLEQLDKDIKALETKEKQLKADKKTLSDEATKLAGELKKLQDENKDKLRQERYEQRVKEQCKKSNEAVCKAITQFVGQLPTPQASQVYTFDEWAQLDQTDKLLDYCKEAIARAKQEQRNSQLIDANPSNGLAVYDSQESAPNTPMTEHFSTDIDYQALFTQYQQWVNESFSPDEKLWWRAPSNGIMDIHMERGAHIAYTRELLKSGDPYRIQAAIEGMKRTLGYGEMGNAV